MTVAKGQKPKIVVSYRRTDAGMAGRIFDRLSHHFGVDHVFIDVDDIPFGVNFRKHIKDALGASSLLVAVVGKNWLGGIQGKPRIEDPDDPVRVELETAFQQGLIVLPVLVDDAEMPAADQLPESIREFSYLNAAEVDSGRDFSFHVDRLCSAIQRNLTDKADPGLQPAPEATRSDTRRWLEPKRLALGIGSLLILAIVSVAFVADRFMDTDETSGSETETRMLLATNSAPLCRDIDAVLTQAGSDFASLKGAPQGGGLYANWQTNHSITGYAECRVTQLRQIAFICESAEVPTKSDAERLLETQGDATEKCLGADWRQIKRASDSRSFDRTDPSLTVGLYVQDNQAFASSGSNPGKTSTPKSYVVTLMIWSSPEPSSAPELSEVNVQPAEQPQDFCDDLKRVIDEASTSFDALLGEDRGGYWPARIVLANWHDCDVFQSDETDLRSRYYSCEISPFADTGQVNAMIKSLAPDVKSCLGPDWTMRRRHGSDKRLRISFDSGATDPEIELRSYYSDIKKRWYVKLDVELR